MTKFKTQNKMRAAVLITTALIALLFSSCAFLEGMAVPEDKPAVRQLAVGDRVGDKTIVWENTGAGSWRFLAMGTPSEPMPWDLNSSKFISVKNLSSDIGAGKENSIFLKAEFEANGSKTHTAANCAVMYCVSKGGWLRFTG
ncbi:hypothetical protein [Treponema putidum]|uniref:hypothetical protein n=1 Tax=Treponema putidum TaxID=221027 RepID=UPI0021085CE4|nr:hypothetical protein [Treponema putidum]